MSTKHDDTDSTHSTWYWYHSYYSESGDHHLDDIPK